MTDAQADDQEALKALMALESSGVTESALRKYPALSKLIFKEGLPSFDELGSSARKFAIDTAHTTLTIVAQTAMREAIEQRKRVGLNSNDPICQTATAGELLQLGTRELYETITLLEKSNPKRVDLGNNAVSTARDRQRTAGIWVNLQYSRVRQRREEFFTSFYGALCRHLNEGTRRTDLQEKLADILRTSESAASTPDVSTEDAPKSSSNAKSPIQDDAALQPTKTLLSRRTTITAVAIVCIVAVAVSIAIDLLSSGAPSGSDTATSTPLAAPNASVVPAPASALPVLVTGVSPVVPNEAAHSFVLPTALSMGSSDLAQFSSSIYPNSDAFSSWYSAHGGLAVDSGLITVTVRGNSDSTVRITDIKVQKTCQKPHGGTYFQGSSQGARDTFKIGFDLDAATPIPQKMASTSASAFFPTGENYFASESLELARGETQTLTLGAFTKRYACKFSFQLIVATPSGTFSEPIVTSGKQFELTAPSTPSVPNAPLSGYQAAYAYDLDSSSWKAVDPKTYKH